MGANQSALDTVLEDEAKVNAAIARGSLESAQKSIVRFESKRDLERRRSASAVPAGKGERQGPLKTLTSKSDSEVVGEDIFNGALDEAIEVDTSHVLSLTSVRGALKGARRRQSLHVTSGLLTPPQDEIPVVQQGSAARIRFLVDQWLPFINELNYYKELARQRVLANYSTDSRFPVHGHDLPLLSQKCFDLTEQWYGRGKGNISAFYKWFIETSEAIEVSAYPFSAIPVFASNDGYCMIIDGKTRMAKLKDFANRDRSHVKYGGLSQKQGVSAIDNTVLCNVMTLEQATVLIATSMIKKWFIRLICERQEQMLAVIGQQLEIDDLIYMQPSTLAAVLGQISESDLRAWGIEPSNLSYRCLKTHGFVLKDWGQIMEVDREKIHTYLKTEVLSTLRARRAREEGNESFVDECNKFVQWCRDQPGEWYENNKHRHMAILLAGMWANGLAVVKRTEMEKFTIAKYIPLEWRRKVDLLNVDETGKVIVKRKAGTIEYSRIRINECPYANHHGMSLAGGESLEGKRRVGLHDQLNLPIDPKARLENWYLNDIEKILLECYYLNPDPSPGCPLLPEETFFDVGQNPKIGSSIARTQHTQIFSASFKDYPVFHMTSHPMDCPAADAEIDLVQVGEDYDSFFVRFRTKLLLSDKLLQCLIGLRIELLQKFGGPRKVDFNVKAFCDEEGGYVVTFHPITQLTVPESQNLVNEDIGCKMSDFNLHPGFDRVDVCKGAGTFLVSTSEGMDVALKDGMGVVRRLYDFSRKPGSRAATLEYLRRFGYSVPKKGKSTTTTPEPLRPHVLARPATASTVHGCVWVLVLLCAAAW